MLDLKFMGLERALKHYTQHSRNIAEIAHNFSPLGFSGLIFMRVYPNNTIINLASNPEWTNFYYNALYDGKYQPQDVIDTIYTPEGANLWALNSENKTWYDAKTLFGIKNGVTITEQHSQYQELIMFHSTQDDRTMNDLYLNHLDELKTFKNYFKKHAKEIIQAAETTKDSFAHHPLLQQKICNQQTEVRKKLIEHVLNSLNFKETTIDWNKVFELTTNDWDELLTRRSYSLPEFTLSKMELKTMIELLKGKHAGEIADSLGIKQTTAKSYLINIKNKLGVNLKSELVARIIETQLFQKIKFH